MARKLSYKIVANTLLGKHIQIFTVREFMRLFDVSKIATQNFLEGHTGKDELFMRLKNGLYAFNYNPPSAEFVAAKLYSPSYISFEYALASYGIIPETTYAITSATSKSTRIFEAMGKEFIYHHIKKSVYTGYVPRNMMGTIYHIAEPEKALLDYLYFTDMKEKPMPDRLRLERIKKTKLLKMVQLYKTPSLVKLVTSLYD